MRGRKSGALLFLAAALFSLTALPGAAAALPEDVSEYMARFAVGRLFVSYRALEGAENAAGGAAGQCDAGDGAGDASCAGSELSGAETPQTPADGDGGDGDSVPVLAVDLSRLKAGEKPRLLLTNETKYRVSLPSAADTPLTIGGGAVLILHTHGTEAYLPDGAERYFRGESFRSRDRERNVVAVGEAFASVLRRAGIEVCHDREMYDAADFRSAYAASRGAARRRLAENPRIRYVIDIHRDGISGADGVARKTQCFVGGEKCAQVMLVVGTDEAGAGHADWRDNLCVAAKYQRRLVGHGAFARPVFLRRSSYNQQLCRGALLLEIGSGANTLGEAKRAAALAAECFVQLYGELGG